MTPGSTAWGRPGERRPLPRSERVDEQQMRDRLGRNRSIRHAPAGGSQPSYSAISELQHQAQPERRQRDARHGRRCAPSDRASGPCRQRRQHAERDADRPGRAASPEVTARRCSGSSAPGRRRPSCGRSRLAEIARGQAREIAQELDGERAVEPVPGANRLDHRLVRRPGRRPGGRDRRERGARWRTSDREARRASGPGRPADRAGTASGRVRPHFVTIASG